MKRQNYLSWDEFFMITAKLTSKRSTEPQKCGAVIVNEDLIIIGSNHNTSTEHAISRVISMVHKQCTETLQKCRLFSINFPCEQCCNFIINTGIKEFIYLQPETINNHLKTRLQEAKIEIRLLEMTFDRLVIDFKQF